MEHLSERVVTARPYGRRLRKWGFLADVGRMVHCLVPEALAAELLEQGVVLTPGSYFGAAGTGFLRLALVPPVEVCERAAEIVSRSRAAPR